MAVASVVTRPPNERFCMVRTSFLMHSAVPFAAVEPCSPWSHKSSFRPVYDPGHAHGQQRPEWERVPCPSTMAASISASQFKARCLGLMDQVAATGEVLVITKNGRPVAELHPCAAPRRPSPFGLHPEASIAGDVLAPIDTAWTALA